MAYQDLAVTQPNQGDGDPLSAAYVQQNTANHEWCHTERPRCRAYAGSNQSIAAGATVAANLTGERFDVGPMHSNVTNPSRLTVPAGGAGIYLIGGHVQMTTAGGFADLRVNGSTVIARQANYGTSLPDRDVLSVSTLWAMTDGDYVELMLTGKSAGNTEVQPARSIELWAIWMASL